MAPARAASQRVLTCPAVTPAEHRSTPPKRDNRRRRLGILALAGISAISYAALAARGDLTADIPVFLVFHGALVAFMVAGWTVVRSAGKGVYRLAIGAALLFRVVAALGEPALSDDVYRYMWDGRVQIHGTHPYLDAPADPALEPLRDENWSRINHPEVRTIYPPLAQMFFAALAALGAGPVTIRLAVGLLDFGVVLVLAALLRRLGFPRDRVVLYAWNPLAVMETAASGHYEPLAVLLVLVGLVTMIGKQAARSAAAVAGAIQAKLVPIVLLPAFVRRWRVREIAVFAAVIVALALPYALTGPAIGAGLFDYAERWERNAFAFHFVFAAIDALDPTPVLKDALATLKDRLGERALPWDWLYRHVWPQHLARAVMALAAFAWILSLAFRQGLDVTRECYLVLAGVLLLLPTMHPWYVLWVLPLAALYLSRGWLLFAALVPLSYLGGEGEVSMTVRLFQYVPALGLMAWDTLGSVRSASMTRWTR